LVRPGKISDIAVALNRGFQIQSGMTKCDMVTPWWRQNESSETTRRNKMKQTNQTISNGNFSFFIVLFALLMLTASASAGLSKSGNIVTDSVTKLQWQDDTTGSTMTWRAAIDHCEGLTLDSHTDWRLPNLRELTSIVDDTNSVPSIDTTAFEHTASNYYWSSTTYAGHTSDAWNVLFGSGGQYYYGKSSSLYVRCVRAGQ
jgi:hypothetical protein